MNKKIMKKWVEALRSGDYLQGRGNLCSENEGGDKFCCLGVLTDLYVRRPGSKEYWGDKNPYSDSDQLAYGGMSCFLSDSVDEWAEMSSPSSQYELASMNDDSKLSFKKIASFIEKKYKEL